MITPTAIIVILLFISVVSFLGFALYRRYVLIKIHGKPEIPYDIQVLRNDFGKLAIDLEKSDFHITGNHKETHVKYEKYYRDKNGGWTLKIETFKGEVIAYYADYNSNISIFLNSSFGKNLGHSRLIYEFQSD